MNGCGVLSNLTNTLLRFCPYVDIHTLADPHAFGSYILPPKWTLACAAHQQHYGDLTIDQIGLQLVILPSITAPASYHFCDYLCGPQPPHKAEWIFITLEM